MKDTEQYMLPIEIELMQANGSHIFSYITLNRKKIKVLIDTGATNTIFDADFIKHEIRAEQLANYESHAAGFNAEKTKTEVAVLNFSMAGLRIRNLACGLIDFAHINQSYTNLGLDHFYGIVGGDILYKYSAVIDYGKKKMILKKAKSNMSKKQP